jgi:hypothetical protein
MSTQHTETLVLENEPCKLSFSSLQIVNQTDTGALISQSAKLFISNEITVKAGSKIVVERGGKEFVFKQSGEIGYFSHHQEIMLVPYEDYS